MVNHVVGPGLDFGFNVELALELDPLLLVGGDKVWLALSIFGETTNAATAAAATTGTGRRQGGV